MEILIGKIVLAILIGLLVTLIAYLININHVKCLGCAAKPCPFHIVAFILHKFYKPYRHIYVGYKLSKLDPDLRALYVRYMILNHVPLDDFEESMYRKFKKRIK